MMHYTFVVHEDTLPTVFDHASYVLHTSKCLDSGLVCGYAQGSAVPCLGTRGNASLGTSDSKILRATVRMMGGVHEHGDYCTMGKCFTCGTKKSKTWGPMTCDRCFMTN